LILEKIDARLVIAGEFWESKDAYLKSIEKLDIGKKVTIIDAYIPNEEIPLFFHASDIVVLPYLTVTGSGLIQLAFGFNKPVVVSGIGSLSEVVRDQETGFLVPPKNPQALANAVTSFFMKSARDTMAEAIKRERNRFSWEHLIKTIEDFLPYDSQ
ncbi:MAG: glycosyltransferase family 4 protein, partial [Candidatus Aminicenantes bacterium]|nr:glycosyltransferase family 4 protein [Candidatus Aminicenantes bacterium]